MVHLVKGLKTVQTAYRCFKCSGSVFNSIYTLKHHILTKHGRRIPAEVDDASSYSSCVLDKNNKSIPPDTNSDTSASDEAIEETKRFKIVTQRTPPKKECPVCRRKFTFDGQLYVHLLRRHRPRVLTAVVCDICGKSYANRKNLRQHQIFCGKPRTGPICEYCGQQCLTNTHLKRHLYVHTGTPEFQCKFCKKKFATERSLTNHTFLHTGATPFKCETCKKAFSEWSILKRHICGFGRQSKECTDCGGIFTTKKMLREHVCTTK